MRMLSFDRALSGRGFKPLAYLMVAIIIVICVATLLVECFLSPESWSDAFLRVLTVFIDPGSVWTVESFGKTDDTTPQWYTLLLTVIGLILFIGVFISILSNMFERRVDRFRNGYISYKLSNHVVVIGFNDLVPMLIKQLVNLPKYRGCEILIQSSVEAEEVRKKVYAELSHAEERRVLFLYARRDSKEELEKLYTKDAKEVFILGDIVEAERDSNNIDCLSQLVEIHAEAGASHKVPFNVMFQSQTTHAAFQITDMGVEWRKYIEFHPFNFYEEWARRVLVKQHWGKSPDGGYLMQYPRMDRDLLLKHDSRHIHLIIIGMNHMGCALGIEAAHLLHFSNAFDQEGGVIPDRKTVITFIDQDAGQKMKGFRNQYRHYFQLSSCRFASVTNGALSEVILPPTNEQGLPPENLDLLDVDFQFIQASASDAPIQNYIKACSTNQDELLTIAICLDDPNRSLELAMYMPDEIYDLKVPILVRQASSSALLRSLGCCEEPKEEGAYRRYAHVYPFGMLDCSFDLDEVPIQMAQIVDHLYSQGKSIDQCGQLPSAEEMHEKWYGLQVSLQWSNLYATHDFAFKMHALGITDCEGIQLTEEQVDELAPVEHARWNIEKLLLGYRQASVEEMELIRKGGKPVRNEYKKRFVHTLIVPFSQLSEAELAYDKNIIRSIPTLLQMFGRTKL